MTTTRVWVVAGLCVVAGLWLLLQVGSTDASRGWATVLAYLLVVMPVGLATNLTARRRRARRREDSPDSVEFRAAHQARSAAFGDTLVLGALLMLALTVTAGPGGWAWGMLFLLSTVVAFWLRYAVALRQLRG